MCIETTDNSIAVQDAWSLVNELLVSLYRLKSKDVRAQICLATWHLDGWIPIAAILTNPMVLFPQRPACVHASAMIACCL